MLSSAFRSGIRGKGTPKGSGVGRDSQCEFQLLKAPLSLPAMPVISKGRRQPHNIKIMPNLAIGRPMPKSVQQTTIKLQ
jgi:hypothetical protein